MEFNRRNSQKNAIERIARLTESEEFHDFDLIQLKARLEFLENSFQNFQNEHMSLIEQNVQPEDMDVQDELATDVEATYMTTKVRFLTSIQALEFELEDPVPDPNVRNEENPRQEPQWQADVRLERIPMNIFNGEYAQWNEWKAMYGSLVHNVPTLSPTQKFHYLKRSVNGSAARVLSGWQILGDNYQAAYESLVKIFENKYRIIIALLEELNNMPKLSIETHDGLREMVDTTNRVLRQLATPAIAAPTEHWDFQVVHRLLVRCPPRTLSVWETTHLQTEMPTLTAFTDFLNQRAMSSLILGQSNANPNGSNQSTSENKGAKPKNKQPRQNFNNADSKENQQKNPLSCYHCKQPHQLYRCLAFQQLSLEQRRARVRELNLCANCFMPGHKANTAQCKFGPCKRCNRNQHHNTLLCDVSIGSVATAQVYPAILPSTAHTDAGNNSTWSSVNSQQASRQNFQ